MSGIQAPPPTSSKAKSKQATPSSSNTTVSTAVRDGATMTRTVVAAESSGRTARAALKLAAGWAATRRIAARAARAVVAALMPAGWLLAATALFGLTAGLRWGWSEWVVAAVAAVALLALAAPFLLGAGAYQIAFTTPRQRVVAGTAADASAEIRYTGRRVSLPARFDIPVGARIAEAPTPLLRPGQSARSPVPIPTERRGVVRVGPASLVRTDPVGVLRREARWRDTSDVYVHPATVRIPASSLGLVRDLDGAPTRQLVDSDVSFHGIREYAPGDAHRHVHWKSTAKTGQLMVRQYEASMRSRVAVVLSCARDEYDDDAEFELAVSAAASIAVGAIRAGRDVEVSASARLPELAAALARVRAVATLPATTPNALLDATCHLELVDAAMPVEEVCRLSAETGAHISLAVVVAGSPVGLRRLRRAALAFPPDAEVVAVVCDEHSHPSMRKHGNLSVLTIGVLADLAGLMVRAATG